MTTATKYKTHSKYKSSGIDWLGDIPMGWEVKKIKHLVNHSKYYQIGDGDHGSIKPEMYQEEGVPYIRVQNLSWDGHVNNEGLVFISNEVQNANLKSKLLPDDVLIAKTGATIGKVALVPKEIEEANTTSSVGKITADQNNYHPKYILYSLISKNFQDQIWIDAPMKSAQPGFNIDDLVGYIVSAPKLYEQKQIVAFLDQETAKIDEMVLKKKKMIDLLKEKRQAFITHAVTKGLDPKAKLKPSGIDWLGNIPEEWKIKKLKHIVKAKRGAIKTGPFGSDLTRDDYVFDEESSFAKIYTQQNIIENDLSLGDDFITKEKYIELIACTLEKDDVVLTTRGTLGRSMIFTSDAPMGVMHPCLLRVQLDERQCLKEFFQLLIQESHYFLEQLVYISNATTIEVLYGDTLKPMQIVLPNILDQKKILGYVAKKSKLIDEMIKKVEMQIEKLQEYRQALITSAVTGKIKI